MVRALDMTDTGRRIHERFECELGITLVWDGQEATGHTINVSLGGMFIVLDREVAYGTEAKVRVTLPALKEETALPVTVRWQTAEGIGVQFGSLRAREVWALNQLVKKA